MRVWWNPTRKERAIKRGRLVIGAYSYGGDDSISVVAVQGSQRRVVIGKFCSLADGLRFYLDVDHRTDWVTTFPFSEFSALPHFESGATVVGHPKSNGDIVLGNDVWAGTNASFVSGVNVGDGAVIAAHAHVVADVPPYAIVGGNPARVLRLRFSAEDIAELLQLKWWDLPAQQIGPLIEKLCAPDIKAAIAAIRAARAAQAI